MRRFLHLCASLVLATASGIAAAKNYAGNTFEIEMIVFSRDSGMAQSGENWPSSPRLEYPQQWVGFDTMGGDSPVLRPVATRLDNKAAAIRRARGQQVLFHKAWQQVLQNKRRSPAVVISGGERRGENHQLEGSVTISVARYLHLSTNLWLSDFGPGTLSAAIPNAGSITLPLPPVAEPEVFGEPMDLAGQVAARPATLSTMSAEPRAPMTATRVALLQQERRMRSGELHYLDHPRFGVLIEVRTVEQEEPQTTPETP
ncbi:CsiV family protein [Microbulbifer guangxiensis]|uniref:CsiV family protein n=1 Tax=Microbulbifer guangxiensis TaxID=2904249 RepID=UPI001F184082|nr:CsiV family protein [Microbulbifer guangxiensis]